MNDYVTGSSMLKSKMSRRISILIKKDPLNIRDRKWYKKTIENQKEKQKVKSPKY